MADLFDASNKGQLALNLLLVFAYLGLNSVLNLTNKWCVSLLCELHNKLELAL